MPVSSGIKTSPDEYCRLCGHACLARRARGETGRCGAGRLVGFSTALLHHGEEPPLSGDGSRNGGSGTIFFTRCVLRCVFCQNWQISQRSGPATEADSSVSIRAAGPQPVSGRDVSVEELADIMLELEARGAFNINLVSPTPYAAQIALALNRAKKEGLALPVVYNTGGYDSLTALSLMDGLVDIYLPDAKIAPPEGLGEGEPDSRSARLLGAGDYPWVNRRALVEMRRQVGPLTLDGQGLARRGFLVRHLVLPDNLARTSLMLPWLSDTFGPTVHLSLMAQYHPTHLVTENPDEFRSFPGLSRPLSLREYEQAVDLALDWGLNNSFIQELSAGRNYLPDFRRPRVFN
ncbi:MAG: radical SAM protein [Candidatus Adiutrix sp.]|jgi:putative pyruvate formate lyase activating enzyme|nr:radical SAM protein [Candidatus Adiutrix sp.]